MSNAEAKDKTEQTEEDDEPDEWDKRIDKTGCAKEQLKMNDCYFDTKDWRACKDEVIIRAPSGQDSQTMQESRKPPRFEPWSKPHLSSPIRRLATTSYRPLATPSTTSPSSPSSSTSSSSPSTSPPLSKPPSTTQKPSTTSSLASGLSDTPTPPLSIDADPSASPVDWTRSFHGLSSQPFSSEAASVLLAPIPDSDVEIKPDGILYLPEIKYRRILNRAFGPGGWGLAPRGESIVTPKSVTREYALVAHGRLVSISRGEQDYFTPDGIPTASEGCKSNAMMRCCKDLGVASELWDPRWIRSFKAKHAQDVWVEHVNTKKKSKIWVRKGDGVAYPWRESKM
ncbi:MAG: hypothetical protein Q9160_001347 [Pyrenula sp. 1 TL-2023]